MYTNIDIVTNSKIFYKLNGAVTVVPHIIFATAEYGLPDTFGSFDGARNTGTGWGAGPVQHVG